MDSIHVRVKIFVSYRRYDKKWVSLDNSAKNANDPNSEQSLISYISERIKPKADIWADHNLDGGDKFTSIIKQEITDAQIAILIISDHFIYSDYIKNEELPLINERYKENKIKVVPVLVSNLSDASRRTLSSFFEAYDTNEKAFIDDTNDLESLYFTNRNEFNKQRVAIANAILKMVDACYEEKQLYTLSQKEVRQTEKSNKKQMDYCLAYLKTYPNGRYVEEVNECIIGLNKAEQEEQLFKEVIDQNSIEKYEYYLNNHKDSKYFAIVKRLYISLIERIKEEETADFYALANDDPRLLYEFIEKYPDNKNIGELKARLLAIEKKEFKSLSKNASKEILEEFLERHPHGFYSKEIEKRIAHLEKKEREADELNYRYACRKNTVEAYDDYIFEEGGGFIEEAEKAKKKLLKVSTWYYKTGRFIYRKRYICGIAAFLILFCAGYQIWKHNRTLPVDDGTDINYASDLIVHELHLNSNTNNNFMNSGYSLYISIKYDYDISGADSLINKAVSLCRNSTTWDEGKELLIAAANKKNACAMYNLAIADRAKYMHWIQKAADNGHAKAQFIRTVYPFRNNAYLNNISANEAQQIITNLEKSSVNGYADATFFIAELYKRIDDKVKMLEYYKRGCQQSDEKCIINVASYYENNNEKNNAFEVLLNEVTKNLHAKWDVKRYLAKAYFQGFGCKKDEQQAFKVLKKAVDYSFDYSLSRILTALYYNGEGCEKDRAYAFNILHDDCLKQNDVDIKKSFFVGLMFLNGDGTSQNADSAAVYFNKIIKKEKVYENDLYYKAHFLLAKQYKDIEWEKCIFHLEQAANMGNNRDAMNMLGCVYLHGFNGITKNTERAMEYLHKAVVKEEKTNYRSPEAMYNLGLIYYNGAYGVKKDKVTGEYYLRLAIENGHQKAKEVVRKLKT